MITIPTISEILEEQLEFTQYNELVEALMTFGGKAYQPFGQVVILAGGAGSGKGFVKDKLLGMEGIVFDVDRLKELVMASEKYNQIGKEKFGVDVSKLNLKKSEDVSKLHDIVSTLDIPDKKLKAVFTSIIAADPTRKPNLIFDVTLKDLNKFYNTLRNVQEMGYWKKNISLVWILNTIDVAISQNKGRSRVVPEEILLATHQGASYTMSEILKMGDKLRTYLDGDIYIVFNQAKVDTSIVSREKGGIYTKKDGTEIEIKGTGDKSDKGFVIQDANYFHVKEKGKAPMNFSEIEKDVMDKIKRYVPNANVWN